MRELQLIGHLSPPHNRHNDIANHEMNGTLMRYGFGEPVCAIRGRDHGKSGDAEVIGDKFPQAGLVFDQ